MFLPNLIWWDGAGKSGFIMVDARGKRSGHCNVLSPGANWYSLA